MLRRRPLQAGGCAYTQLQQLPHPYQQQYPYQAYAQQYLQAAPLLQQQLSKGSDDSAQSIFEDAFQAAMGGATAMDTENTPVDREAAEAAAAVDRVKVRRQRSTGAVKLRGKVPAQE